MTTALAYFSQERVATQAEGKGSTRSSDQPGSTLSRKHVRTPTQLNARVRFADSIIAGMVTDFSETGLLVTFPQEGQGSVAFSAPVGSELEVTIPAEHGESSPPLQIKGNVARVASDGVGLVFPRLAESALQALREADTRRAMRAALLESGDLKALQRECNSLFGRFLDSTLQEFFAGVADALAQSGDEERSFMERSRYRYMAEDLTQQRVRIEADFFGSIRKHLRRIGLGEEQEEKSLLDSEALSVLGDAELEDSLNLESAIKGAETVLAADLEEFEQRYSRLVRRSIGRDDNPFRPLPIFRSLRAALQRLDFSNRMRAVLYRTLGQAISKHGPALFERLNSLLEPLEPFPHAPEPAKPALQSRIAHAPAPRAEEPPTPSGQPRSADSVDLLQMIDRLQQHRRTLDNEASPAREAPFDSGGEANLTTLHAITAALDNLPLDQLSGRDGPTVALSGHVEARVAAMEGTASRLAPVHRRILDTTSQIFERARIDVVADSDVADLIKRLERPLLKLALQDQSFPAADDHPARQVFNLIERFSVAADENGKINDPKLLRFLQLVVDRISARVNQDPGIYDLASKNLWKVLKPILGIRRDRVMRLQEASEAWCRVQTGRARVDEVLDRKLGGREVPFPLVRLLDAGWRQHMVLLETRHGAGSSEWHAALNLIDRVHQHLTLPGSRPGDLPDLLKAIDEGISTVCVEADIRNAIINEIKDTLEDPAPTAPMVFIPAGSLTAPHPSAAQDHKNVTDALRVGDWWSFDQQGRSIPMQLIWLSRSRSSCTFSDRSATRKLTLTFGELARRIRDNAVKLESDRDLPLLDRAEFALFDDSYRSLLHQALHDPLTGLLNRKGFMQHMQTLGPLDDEGDSLVVGVLEFDQSRLVRNNCGEVAGESLAREVASHARDAVGLEATVAMLHEDTIAFLSGDCGIPDKEAWGTGLLDRLKTFTFRHREQSYSIGFSLGLSDFHPSRSSAAEALRRADAACINAKSLGRNQMRIYEEERAEIRDLERQMNIAGHLDGYLGGDGLFLRCQQVMPLAETPRRSSYFEVLLGVHQKDGEPMNPFDFVTAVERLHRAHELDLWVIERIFAWIGANRPLFDTFGGFAVNLSASSLHNIEVYDRLRGLLAEADFPTAKLVFEITESAAIEGYGMAQEFIRGLQQYGSRFCLDDFGTGFTSYAHLKNLRADTLKIDGTFVRDMLTNEADFAMVKSMNDLAHSLGLASVAEYVESPELAEALKAMGVDYAQGYAIHKPCHIDELSRVLPHGDAELDSSVSAMR